MPGKIFDQVLLFEKLHFFQVWNVSETSYFAMILHTIFKFWSQPALLLEELYKVYLKVYTLYLHIRFSRGFLKTTTYQLIKQQLSIDHQINDNRPIAPATDQVTTGQ